MISRDQWREFSQSKPVRTTLFMVGLLLIIVSPLAGAIPGPGGVFVFAAGLALALKNSEWAKRQYVRFKRKQPKAGRWADWGLRRRSFRRREELRKQRTEQRALRAAAEAERGGMDETIPDPPQHPPETWADREGRAHRRDAAD
ncbi:MAG: hypothetical protein M3438_07385 [Pseudomonadota bacterium]|nr:hypothetical protein [Pseudomonadota bacterium]